MLKRYLEIMKQIEEAEDIPYDEIELIYLS